MLILPLPPARFSSPSPLSPSLFLRHHHSHHLILSPPPFSTTSSSSLTSLQNRHYDFSPLLQFLSNTNPTTQTPTSLHPTELHLAESYRSVLAPLWHSLLKSLSSSSSTFDSAAALVEWLQRHNLCFSYELLYSILIHSLGHSQKLYHAFLLSHESSSPPSPLTYNALISACARNDDLDKAFHLLSGMCRDGFGWLAAKNLQLCRKNKRAEATAVERMTTWPAGTRPESRL